MIRSRLSTLKARRPELEDHCTTLCRVTKSIQVDRCLVLNDRGNVCGVLSDKFTATQISRSRRLPRQFRAASPPEGSAALLLLARLYETGIWDFADGYRRGGYSVVLFGPNGERYRHSAGDFPSRQSRGRRAFPVYRLPFTRVSGAVIRA
jgi:hypothetical protein